MPAKICFWHVGERSMRLRKKAKEWSSRIGSEDPQFCSFVEE
jgi:hypothetical protein